MESHTFLGKCNESKPKSIIILIFYELRISNVGKKRVNTLNASPILRDCHWTSGLDDARVHSIKFTEKILLHLFINIFYRNILDVELCLFCVSKHPLSVPRRTNGKRSKISVASNVLRFPIETHNPKSATETRKSSTFNLCEAGYESTPFSIYF